MRNCSSSEAYLSGYSNGAYLVSNLLRRFGWARAKGEVKQIISMEITQFQPEQSAFYQSYCGYIDAMLDSVN